MPQNRVEKLLQIEYPVVQAPMNWISAPEVVAAVSKAGGLGVLGPNAGAKVPAQSVEQTGAYTIDAIRRVKALTDKPFAVNVVLERESDETYAEEIVRVACEEGVAAIAFCGAPRDDLFQTIKNAGCALIYRDPKSEAQRAHQAQELGADIVVATGFSAGGGLPGHTLTTEETIAKTRDVVSVPLLAAGGIANEADARKMRDAGADGVYVGSRFILSTECRAHASVKRLIADATTHDLIVVTTGKDAVRNRCIKTPHTRSIFDANEQGDLHVKSGNTRLAYLEGDLGAGLITVGCGVVSVDAIVSCAEIVRGLARGFYEELD